MLSVALAALSGLIWGVGDFSGGKASQRAAVLPVVWISKLVSLPLLAIYLIATYVPVTPVGVVWGGLAGIAGVVGLVLFYRALSAGAMTVVAPVTGVTSAAIPVVVGLVAGERPPASRLLGVGCALLAIALVSLAPHPAGQRQIVTRRLALAALGAGTGFALFFILARGRGQGGRRFGRALADRRFTAQLAGDPRAAVDDDPTRTVAASGCVALDDSLRSLRHDSKRALPAGHPGR